MREHPRRARRTNPVLFLNRHGDRLFTRTVAGAVADLLFGRAQTGREPCPRTPPPSARPGTPPRTVPQVRRTARDRLRMIRSRCCSPGAGGGCRSRGCAVGRPPPRAVYLPGRAAALLPRRPRPDRGRSHPTRSTRPALSVRHRHDASSPGPARRSEPEPTPDDPHRFFFAEHGCATQDEAGNRAADKAPRTSSCCSRWFSEKPWTKDRSGRPPCRKWRISFEDRPE